MEVSSQIHAPAILALGKEFLIPMGWEDEWATDGLAKKICINHIQK
jgi:hypothetical protein